MTVITSENFNEALPVLQSPKLAVDLETTGLNPFAVIGGAQICGIALYNGNQSIYLSVKHSGTPNITDMQLHMVLSRLQEVDLVNHNIGFDIGFLMAAGMRKPTGKVTDTMVGLYLQNELRPKGLKDNAKRLFGEQEGAQEAELEKLLLSWGYTKADMWRMPAHVAAPYAEQDTILAWRLEAYLREHLPESLIHVWDMMGRTVVLLSEMRHRGIQVDVRHAHLLEKEAHLAAFDIERELARTCGRGLNPNSPSSVASFFKLPNATYETLTARAGTDNRLGKLLEHRAWRKSIDTYYRPYRKVHCDASGVIHTDLKICGTVTGRLSSREPNLQAVPKRSNEQKVKDIFVARPGFVLAELDYSQAEIRVAAHYTGEAAIVDALRANVDIHQAVADDLKCSRQQAKIINFATIYGAGATVLASQLNMTVPQAQKLLYAYHDRYPEYRNWTKKAERVAIEQGYVTMWNGRRRHFTEKDSEPRTAFNSVIQGGTAQMVLETMNRVNDKFPEVHQLVQIHDALLLEVPEEKHEELIRDVKKEMEHQPWCKIPMPVEAKVGPDWGHLTKVEYG